MREIRSLDSELVRILAMPTILRNHPSRTFRRIAVRRRSRTDRADHADCDLVDIVNDGLPLRAGCPEMPALGDQISDRGDPPGSWSTSRPGGNPTSASIGRR